VAKHNKLVPGRLQLGVASTNRTAAASFDAEVRREQNYNTGDRVAYVQSHIPKLAPEQKGNYEQIMQIVNNGVGEIVFVDAPGGTGKTFLRKFDSGRDSVPQ
jgi:hypothetical protein